MMTPQVLAISATIYSGERRARALATYGMAMGVAGVLGQLPGELPIQADIAGSSQRGIFLINVPVGIGGLASGPRGGAVAALHRGDTVPIHSRNSAQGRC